MKLHITLLILLSVAVSFPQQYQFERSIGKFVNASSFYINSAGFIYVSDIATDEITALDTVGNILKKIGGYGWRESAFDNPADIFADALKVYVADKNNNRIQRFDKNLNFNFQIYTRESENEQERFGYPLSAVMSNLGDIFILDSENSRLVKFDIFGNFLQNFGGYDYGNFALEKPIQLAVSMQNNIFVIDGSEIVIFDQYGNGVGRTSSAEEFESIRIIFDWLTVTTNEKIFTANLRSPDIRLNEIILSGIDDKLDLVSALIFNNKLYVLTNKEIVIFSRM